MQKIKVERRVKYAGVKIHLDGPQAAILAAGGPAVEYNELATAIRITTANFIKDDPGSMQDRSAAEVAAILAKESEKAALQLKKFQAGSDWATVDPKELKKAMKAICAKQGDK